MDAKGSDVYMAPKAHINIRVLETMVVVSPVYWALKPECIRSLCLSDLLDPSCRRRTNAGMDEAVRLTSVFVCAWVMQLLIK